MNNEKRAMLTEKAKLVRRGIIESTHSAGCGHPGGSLSVADIVTYLYFAEMHIDPKNPAMPDRDRFVLSKGHAAPALYAALANRGYFPVEDLKTLRKTGSYLQGHPDMKGVPGVDMSTGSLGLGFSAACGIALAGKCTRRILSRILRARRRRERGGAGLGGGDVCRALRAGQPDRVPRLQRSPDRRQDHRRHRIRRPLTRSSAPSAGMSS